MKHTILFFMLSCVLVSFVLFLAPARPVVAAGTVTVTNWYDNGAGSLREAIDRFPAGAEAAVERALRELEALRREAASSIIVPGGGGGLIQRP